MLTVQENVQGNVAEKKKRKIQFRDISLLIALAALILFFYVMEHRFLQIQNIYNIILQISTLTPLTIGMTMVILTGGIDLSVGSVMAFSQCYMAGMMLQGKSPILAIIVCLIIALVMGCCNGLMISFLRMPPFIATLGMMSIGRGMQLTHTLGATLYNYPDSFRKIATGTVGTIPIPVFIVIALYIIFHLIMKYTVFGRSVYAIGGNAQAARISGINVEKITTLVYSIAGLLTGVAGIIQLARLNASDSSTGDGIEMDAIAAVVIGGTSMSGGKGSVLKTAIGTLVYGVILNGLNVAGVSPFIQKTVIGALILFAVFLDVFVSEKVAERQVVKVREAKAAQEKAAE